MRKACIHVRLMKAEDFDAIVAIDEKVLKASRPEYYEMRFEKLFSSADYLPTSLVAEEEGGKVIGFIMGELFIGEYGISQDGATLDTIGVDPNYQKKGVGEKLVGEFVDHLRRLDVKKVNTLVDMSDSRMMHFFRSNQFSPSTIVSLERRL